MRLFKYYSTFLILWLASLSAWSQSTNENDPLFDHLRTKVDSALVLYSSGGWSQQPGFVILAKKGDKISYYCYVGHLALNNTDTINRAAVQKRFEKMRTLSRRIKNYKKSEYYFLFPKTDPEKMLLWQNVLAHNPWGIKDDKAEGSGCPVVKGGRQLNIMDGIGYRLALITKNEIKKLGFYEPQRYEQVCPGREGRRAIIKIKALFRD